MAELSDFRSSVAVVVSSCDAFFDAWQPFSAFWRKFWSDCPLEIFLLTNHLRVVSSRFQSLAVGTDRGWSTNLLLALDQISHDYVLYFQEDYFLTAPVARAQLAEDFSYTLNSDADSLCFRARAHPDTDFQPTNERFGVVPLTSDGRTRCQVTLWKRRALEEILRSSETAWDFEAKGSARTQKMQILSYQRQGNTPVPYLMSAISRGLWMPEAVAMCGAENVVIDPFFRPLYAKRPWQRRLRRALGRGRLKRALRQQVSRAIEL